MFTDDGQIDGSWNLSVNVIDVKEQVTLRVTGEKSIGSVMYMLVEKISTKMNWSDHGLWWPARKRWLLQTRATLDQCGVQSDAQLLFVRMHNIVRVRLPDLQVRDMRVNFSKKVFGVVVQLCHDLGIRHPEELSLMRPITADDLKLDRISSPRPLPIQSCNPNALSQHAPSSPRFNGSTHSSPALNSRFANGPPFTPMTPNSPATPHFLSVSNSPQTLGRSGHHTNGSSSHTLMPASVNSLRFEGVEETMLANSPIIATEEVLSSKHLIRLKTLQHRARIHGAWLESSRSLMEQDIVPNEETLIYLRFKFHNFYDLNPKYDAIRINQLYQQAKWSLISEETECNEEEMIVFAALQLQVRLQTDCEIDSNSVKSPSSPVSPNSVQLSRRSTDSMEAKQSPKEIVEDQVDEDDEVDCALAELQMQLEGGDITSKAPKSPLRSPGLKDAVDGKGSTVEVLDVPQLSDYLKFFKPRKLTIKSYKRMWIVLRETSLMLYRHHQDVSGSPCEMYQLQRCEIQPDVNVSTSKYGLRLFIAGSGESMQEIWLRCDSKEQYAQWMAACRLASSGKTLASRSQFDTEKESTLTFLDMQTPSPQPILTKDSMPKIDLADFVSRSIQKKIKGKTLLHRIAEAHTKIRTMSSLEAKSQFIKNWKQLSNYGISRFLVRFQNSKKDESFGITDTRLIRMDGANGDLIKSWRLKDIQSWHVNWNTENVIINFPDEKIVFHPLSADCKTLHEFVGGYVFMNMRSPEKSQELNEAYFHKLTGGNQNL